MTYPTPLRLQLLAAGFEPIPAHGKRVPVPDWPRMQIDAEVIERWKYYDCANTGLRTRNMPALDVDVLNAEAVQAIEAFVFERFAPHGRVCVRTGKAPKIAIPFRTNVPFPKMSVHLQNPLGAIEKLEFLGSGQQIICFGIHPQTGLPYTWRGGEPGAVKLAELPAITQAEAIALMMSIAGLLSQFGYRHIDREPLRQTTVAAANRPVIQKSRAKNAQRYAHLESENYEAPPQQADAETAARVWDHLKLIDPDLSRDRWFKLGCSCFVLLGPTDGFDCWDAWSAQGVKYKAREMRSQWASIVKAKGYGFAWRRIYQEYEWAQNARMTDDERANFAQSIANLTKRKGG